MSLNTCANMSLKEKFDPQLCNGLLRLAELCNGLHRLAEGKM